LCLFTALYRPCGFSRLCSSCHCIPYGHRVSCRPACSSLRCCLFVSLASLGCEKICPLPPQMPLGDGRPVPCVLCVVCHVSLVHGATHMCTCRGSVGKKGPLHPTALYIFQPCFAPGPPTYNYCHRLSGPCHLFVLSLAPRRSLPVASGQRRGRHPSFLTSFLSSFPLLLSFALSAYRL